MELTVENRISGCQPPLELIDEKEAAEKNLIDAYRLLDNQHPDMIYLLLRIIKDKEGFFGDYWKGCRIAYILARDLNLPSKQIIEVQLGALLRDVGKFSISPAIWGKKERLTEEEYNCIKTHSFRGYEIIKDYVNDYVSKLVLYHHEYFNGEGYPFGLKGDRIPLEARIIGLADMYNALRSKRPYRDAFTKEKAFEIIDREKGVKFDPCLVERFLSVVELVEGELV